MPQLKISLLGTFRVTLNDQPVTGFESNKVRALLAYLAIEAKISHSRSKLAGMLWPDMPETSALSNLRYALSDLRNVIGDRIAIPPHLRISRQSIQFNPSSENWLDVHAFETLLEAGEDMASDMTAFCQAVDIYHGSFLEGFSIPGSTAFEEWLLLERERLHQLVLKALQRISNHYEIAADFERAQSYTIRQLALDPWLEEAHRQLMRLMAYRGRRSLAIAQFDTCRRILAKELGVEPANETIKLYENIRDGTISVPPAPPAFLLDAQPLTIQHPIFVSRRAELNRLERSLRCALTDEGQVVFVTGDAGHGKTALVHEFSRRTQLAHPELVVVTGSGHAYFGTGDPYLPFREILEMLTGDVEDRWAAGAISRDQAHRLWLLTSDSAKAIVDHGPGLIDTFVPGSRLLNRASQTALETANWLDQLREIIESHQKALPGPQPVQEDLFHQYGKVLRTIARKVPLLIFLDDLQWADRGTLDLLFYLCRQLSGARILITGAFRPEGIFTEISGSRPTLAAICNDLQILFGDIFINLDEAEGRDFVNAYLDSEPNRLGDTFRDRLYLRTRGSPLFTIEVLRGMQERGELIKSPNAEWIESPSINWDKLPPRVDAAIAERLSRLPELLKRLLQSASVEGERFTAEVIAHILGMDENTVREYLSEQLDRKYRLVRAESARYVDGKYISRYRFHHLLLQMYFYNELDPVLRVHLHKRIGEGLEELYENRPEEIAVQLAHHFQEANIPAKSIDYLLFAGNCALKLSANEEAMTHFSKALDLIETLPHTAERDSKELNTLISMSVALMLARGYASQELGQICDRARQKIQNTEEKPELFPMIWHLGSYYSMRAEYPTALTLVRQLVRISERTGDPLQKLLHNWGLGFILLRTGEFDQSLLHLEGVIRIYDFEQHRELAYIYGTDPLAACLTWSSWALWLLGYPDQAKQRSQEAIRHAQKVSHPGSLVFALGVAAFLYLFIKEPESALNLIESGMALAVEHKLPFWLVTLTFLHGWAQVELGQIDDGLVEMRKGLGDFSRVGTKESLSLDLTQIGIALAQAGLLDEGFNRLEEAEVFIHDTGERMYQAELLRIRGEMLLMLSEKNQEQAAQYFLEAKQKAIGQKAKSWELRAALSLRRLLQKQGRQQEAYEQLAQVYAWFTEGFQTPDLKEVRRLLGKL